MIGLLTLIFLGFFSTSQSHHIPQHHYVNECMSYETVNEKPEIHGTTLILHTFAPWYNNTDATVTDIEYKITSKCVKSQEVDYFY